MTLEQIMKLSEDDLLDLLPTMDLDFFECRDEIIYPIEIREYLLQKVKK